MMELTPADREYCRDITLKVLDRTLHDYADTASWASGSSSSSSRSDVEHDRWKQLRSQDNVSMYAESAADLSWVPSIRGGEWHRPVAVVAIGRMCCSLQDVLYGLVVSDPAEFKLRAVLMGQKMEDDVQVEAITVPSEGEPFQFMGVTRSIVHHGCLQRPQEYVLVTATGEVFTSCGEHLGYEITQSVAMSRWPVKSSVVRKQILQARVLRELPDGSVGVYQKFVVDSRNFMPDAVVQASLWRTILDFWEMAPRCAEAKKLCYCVEHSRDFNFSAQHSPCGSADPFACGACNSPLLNSRRRSLGDIASAVARRMSGSSSTQAYRCALCSSWLCSKARCRVARQLVRIDRGALDVNRQSVVLCITCADIVRRTNATEIARRGLREIHATFNESPAPYAGSCGKCRAP